MAQAAYLENGGLARGLKVAFRDVARTTDERSMIATVVADMPCGNTLGVLEANGEPLLLLASLASLVVDACVRVRMAGTHLNYFVIDELPLLPLETATSVPSLSRVVQSLACGRNSSRRTG